MTYLFDTYRHTCGRTISIYDTEPCLCETKEEKMKQVSKPRRSLLRLLRRARAHGFTPWHIVNDGHGPIVAQFKGRHVRINEDGSFTADIALRHTPDGDSLRPDPHWRSGSANRWHTFNMMHAAACRQQHMYASARFALRIAKEERVRRLND